jgi:hypothetical protein
MIVLRKVPAAEAYNVKSAHAHPERVYGVPVVQFVQATDSA